MAQLPEKSLWEIQDKQRKINILSGFIWVGLFFAVAFHYAAGSHYGLTYPWDTFLVLPADHFMDFYNYYDAFEKYRFSVTMFPTVNLFLFLFSGLQKNTAFAVFINIFILYFICICYRVLKISSLPTKKTIRNIFIIGLMSYPFLFVFDRGNLEAYMFIFVSLFAFLFQQKRYYWASFFLALAIGMKLFPAVFFILYLKEKRYKELGVLGLFLLLLGLSLFLAKDIQETVTNSNSFFDLYFTHYIIGNAGFAFGHSLFALVKSYYYTRSLLMGEPMTQYFVSHSGRLLHDYAIFTFIAYAAFAIFVYRSKTLSYWRQVCILVLLFCLLPNVSGDYKLIHIFTPLLLYINSCEKTRYEKYFIYLFSLLLIPKAYYVFPIGVSTSVIVTPLIMLIFLYMLVTDKDIASA